MRARDWLRDAGWLFCVLLGRAGLCLLGQRLRLPTSGLASLPPLLLLGIAATVAWFAWRCGRRPALHAVAAEADARAGLNDELASAWWFAHQATPSAWEVVM